MIPLRPRHSTLKNNNAIKIMYKKRAHIHFMGIGGIGMSGIATILRHQGYTVSGCDADSTQNTIKKLHAIGCLIQDGHNGTLCHDPSITTLVYSSAIQQNNPEIQHAIARNIPIIPRALMLAELMRTKYSIAIAGAHGKTTTTSLIAHILIEAEQDPTVIIGGMLKNISHNARIGTGDFLVAEADESDRSFLHLYPTIAVVTNIDNEHLDTYSNIDDIKNTFTQFLSNIPFYGKAIVCIDDPHLQSILPITHIKTIKYGLTPAIADIYAHNIILEPTKSQFTVSIAEDSTPLGTITLSMPGRHNILNALAAIAVAQDLEVPFDAIANALHSFQGVERRFTYRGTYQGALVFDDYGHHPTEIYHTLKMARIRSNGKLIVVFQPHRYSRTQHLWHDFIKVFVESDIDHLIITDIYAASEHAIPHITSQALTNALQKESPRCSITYVPYDKEWREIQNTIHHLAQENDLILALGAGSIYRICSTLTDASIPAKK